MKTVYTKSLKIRPALTRFLFLSLAFWAGFTPSTLADVISWRNGSQGLYAGSQVPTNWEDERAVKWKIDTPQWGNASPILIDNKLIFTEEPATLVCVDSESGDLLWRVSNDYEDVAELTNGERARLKQAKLDRARIEKDLEPVNRQLYRLNRRFKREKDNQQLGNQVRALRRQVADARSKIDPILDRFEKPKTHKVNGYASFTPCSDGEYVYNCNGLGIVTKHDLDGNRIWSKTMEKPDHNWGGSSSPLLVDGKLIIRFSDYTALDAETGEELWRVANPISFGPPVSFQLEDQSFLYTTRGELIRIRDGKKLPSQDWVIPQKKFAFFNTNFVAENRIYAVHGAKALQGDLYCMEIPETVEELESTGLKQLWHAEVSQERYYASPLEHEGLVYIFSMGQTFQVLEADTGNLVYSKKVPGKMDRAFSGLLLVEDLIYAGEEGGMAFFLKPGRRYKEVSRFNVGECRSVPIFDGDVAYLRTREHLFAFSAKR
ncbi:MAG: hypothetical protein CMI15_04910 [Opitutaceae bacterium]|nr:hypothetical protein [Opitutaceae bacterium]